MDFLETASSFLFMIWDFIVQLFTFLTNSGAKTIEFFKFLFSVVLEIPYMLLTVFNNLPDFMQLGISIVFHGVLFIFILKIIKIIRDVTI